MEPKQTVFVYLDKKYKYCSFVGMNLSCKDISSDSTRDTDDMKKEPNLFRKPKQSFRETGQKHSTHIRVCVPDAVGQMIGKANNDSCRTATIAPYKERLHLKNLVITCTL